MGVELNTSLCEPGDGAAGKTMSSFDDFRIGRGGAGLRGRKRLLNTHFVTSDFGAISGNPEAGDRMATGSEDRRRPWYQGLGGLGSAQNDDPAHRIIRSDTKQ